MLCKASQKAESNNPENEHPEVQEGTDNVAVCLGVLVPENDEIQSNHDCANFLQRCVSKGGGRLELEVYLQRPSRTPGHCKQRSGCCRHQVPAERLQEQAAKHAQLAEEIV